MAKTVDVPASVIALCSVKAKAAADLTRDEIKDLMNWCDWQRESLWDGMGLQEILNVYRASAAYDSFEGMEQENPAAARKAWNAAIIKPANRLIANA